MFGPVGQKKMNSLMKGQIKMNWNEMTTDERLKFCDERMSLEFFFLRTAKEWNELSPTTQLILKSAGILNKGLWEKC
jgi:hypothetical protein